MTTYLGTCVSVTSLLEHSAMFCSKDHRRQMEDNHPKGRVLISVRLWNFKDGGS